MLSQILQQSLTLPGRSALVRSASRALFQPSHYHFQSTKQIATGRNITASSADKLFKARLNTLPVTGTMTKVVCTIGPATDSVENINDLVKYGMSVARLNFSHAGSDYSYPEQCLERVRAAPGKHHQLATGGAMNEHAKLLPNNVRAILVDTKGPEIRTGPLQGNAEVAEIEVGDRVDLTTRDVSADPAPAAGDHYHVLHVDYQSIAKSLEPGKQALLDDGLIALEVEEVDPSSGTVICTALNGGPIKKNKGVNLPDTVLDLPALTEKDKRDLQWACAVGADFVAASFIRTAANVRAVVAYLDRCINELPPNTDEGRARKRPLVISKIESKEGVDNFDEILEASDGIMVARGDLGVEIPYSKVFAAQKMMVNKCNRLGRSVIVATQMLDSMQTRPRPTRAEVTDVGTAVLDGTDATMLSGETAAGKYPMEALRSMASVVHESDMIRDDTSELLWNEELYAKLPPEEQELDAVAVAACRSAKDMRVKAIVVITQSGRVARAVARHLPSVPVLAFCTDVQVARRLQLHRAVVPLMLQSHLDPKCASTRLGELRAEAVRTAKELGFIEIGDRIIMVDQTKGKQGDHHKFAHNLKVVTIQGDQDGEI